MEKGDYLNALKNMDREELLRDLKEIWGECAKDAKEEIKKLAAEAENIVDCPTIFTKGE